MKGELDPATTKAADAAKQVAAVVTEKARDTRAKVAAEYGMTAKQVENDEKSTEAQVKAKVERAYVDHQIALNHIDAEGADAATEAEFIALDAKKAEAKAELDARVLAIFHSTLDSVTETVVTREETK